MMLPCKRGRRGGSVCLCVGVHLSGGGEFFLGGCTDARVCESVGGCLPASVGRRVHVSARGGVRPCPPSAGRSPGCP